MTTSYERGRAIEYRIQRELEALGYTTARAAGSKGKFDVLAWDHRIYRIIQAKSFIKRPGSFKDDVEQIRSILCPPNTRREFWIWKHRQGWQAKIILGSRPEEDCLLELAERPNADPWRYNPSVVEADGYQRPFYQPVPQSYKLPASITDYSGLTERRAYGTPITVSCVGTQELRDVLSGVRSAVEKAGLQPVLLNEVSARRTRKA